MKQKAVILLLLAAFAVGILAGAGLPERTGERLPFSKRDLAGGTMLVKNFTCSSRQEMMPVDDPEFYDEVVALMTKAVPFRNFISFTDLRLGAPPEDLIAIVQTGTAEYRIIFADYAEQLRLDSPLREKPLVLMSSGPVGWPETEWTWYCSLSPADYSELFLLLEYYYSDERVPYPMS